jgi:hypothetical protein
VGGYGVRKNKGSEAIHLGALSGGSELYFGVAKVCISHSNQLPSSGHHAGCQGTAVSRMGKTVLLRAHICCCQDV